MIQYQVRLYFGRGRETVFGIWDEREPAERKYREWLGLYAVALTLVQDEGGHQRVLKSWPPPEADTGT